MTKHIFPRFPAIFLALLAAIFFVQGTKAQGGPPMITDDTGTVPKGHWEINTAFTWERTADGRMFGTPLLDVNYGLSRNTQLKVEIPWIVLNRNGERSINGAGNTSVAVRWRFRDEREHHRVALSIYPAFEFNTSHSSVRRGIVDKGPEFLMPLQIQTQIGKYGINGDVGYRFKRGTDEIIYGFVVGRTFREKFDVLGEIHGTGPRNHLGANEVVYNFGSRVKLTKHATLLLSAGSSLIRNRDPQFIGYAGLQLNF
ncbi:MAG: hypothetical protein HOP17_07370 [Acidobacteria bacterium]|nr:hypothetical protein [Acidobacteriota bacterium]